MARSASKKSLETTEEPGSFLKRSSAKAYIKDASGAGKFNEDAMDIVESRIDQLIVELAATVGELIRKENRSTIMDRDIEAAFDQLFGGGSGPGHDPDRIFRGLLSTGDDELAEVIRLVHDWIEEQKSRPPTRPGKAPP